MVTVSSLRPLNKADGINTHNWSWADESAELCPGGSINFHSAIRPPLQVVPVFVGQAQTVQHVGHTAAKPRPSSDSSSLQKSGATCRGKLRKPVKNPFLIGCNLCQIKFQEAMGNLIVGL